MNHRLTAVQKPTLLAGRATMPARLQVRRQTVLPPAGVEVAAEEPRKCRTYGTELPAVNKKNICKIFF
jgi:hypothetical protein